MKTMKMELMAMKMVSVIILYIKLYNKNIFYICKAIITFSLYCKMYKCII